MSKRVKQNLIKGGPPSIVTEFASQERSERIRLDLRDPETLAVFLPKTQADIILQEMRTGKGVTVQPADPRDGHTFAGSAVGRIVELVFDDGSQSPFFSTVDIRDFADGTLPRRDALRRVAIYRVGDITPALELPATTDIEFLPDGTIRSNSLEVKNVRYS